MPDTTNDRHAAQGAIKVSSMTVEHRIQREATGNGTWVPEWTTERWKHRLEAEARTRLKHNLHDVRAAHRLRRHSTRPALIHAPGRRA